MSSILTRARDETTDGSATNGDGGPLMQVLRIALEESEMGASSAGRGRKIGRAFLVIDVEAAVKRLLGGRGSSGTAGALAESMTDIDVDEGSDASGGRRGRGALSTLFVLGVVVGLGYVLRSRSESVGEVVGTATERAQSVADETARRSGEVAQRTTAVTGQVADRIEQSGEMAADRVEETGEMAADRIEESGETAADRIQEGGEAATDRIEDATETVEEMEEEATETAEEAADEGEAGEETEETEE